MFIGSAANLELITLFQLRKVSLYHACQLKDLRTYLKIGGIPSRKLMSQQKLDFTVFKSDVNDEATGDWSKVFLNMTDFGNFFHYGSLSTPNIYGPILIKLNPDCIENAVDTAICLTSAGSKHFDRAAASLKSIEEVEKVFAYGINDPLKSSWIHTAKHLKTIFSNIPVKSSPEISCTIANELISFDYITAVIVDPLEHDGLTLQEEVKLSLTEHHEILGKMVRRSTKQHDRYKNLIKAVADGHLEFANLSQVGHLSDWASGIKNNGLQWQYERFAEYILNGTLSEMKRAS